MDRQTEIHKSLETALMDIGFRARECPTVAPVLAENLIAAGWKPPPATSAEHKCRPPEDPGPLPSAAIWKCPVDGIEYISVKRMISGKMHVQWRRRSEMR